MADAPPGFKVIVVGGGPVGLTMAHALAAAGIDFVVLERYHTFVSDNGAGVGLWPPSIRLLDQLGLLAAAREVSVQLHRKVNVRPDGRVVGDNPIFDMVAERHGKLPMLFRRGKLTQMLHETLPGREAKTFAGKEVDDIELTDSGVKVLCADGSVFEGSMVVGADGVHSNVRQIMGRLSTASRKPLGDQTDCFGVTFRGFYGYADLPPGVESGILFETRGKEVQFQLMTTKDSCYFGAYIPLPADDDDQKKDTGGDGGAGRQQQRGGLMSPEEEEEEVVKWLAGYKVSPTATFGDVWAGKKWSRLDDLDEGKIHTWHFGGRIVLVGDAVHRMCPHIGWGLNSGMQEVVSLTNLLQEMMLPNNQQQPPSPSSSSESGMTANVEKEETKAAAATDAVVATSSSSTVLPTAAELDRVFAAYQAERGDTAEFVCKVSARIARMVAWMGWWWRVVDKVVVPLVGEDRMMKLIMTSWIRDGLVFDFLEEKEQNEPKIRWKNHPRRLVAPQKS